MLLADQDRSLWDRTASRPGAQRSTGRSRCGGRGPYVLQAAIAALHLERPTDWAQIAALYGELAAITGSAVVELNRAVAVAEVDGPAAALEWSTGWTSTAIATSTRPEPSSCAGSGATPRRGRLRRALELAGSRAGAPLPRAAAGRALSLGRWRRAAGDDAGALAQITPYLMPLTVFPVSLSR